MRPGKAHGRKQCDYWLIPARTALGDIVRSNNDDVPGANPPHGVEHHLAPLALLTFADDGDCEVLFDFRREYRTLTEID